MEIRDFYFLLVIISLLDFAPPLVNHLVAESTPCFALSISHSIPNSLPFSALWFSLLTASGSNRQKNSKIRSNIFIGNRFESTLWPQICRACRLRNMNTKLSNKEAFLCELVSNASDALDKHQFLVITQHELLKDGVKLDIRIQTDKDNGIITITDSGISMTRDELVSSLGTITEWNCKVIKSCKGKQGCWC